MSIILTRSITVAVAAAALIVTTAATGAAGGGGEPAPSTVAQALVLHDGSGDVWTYSDATVGFTHAARPDADVLRATIVAGSANLRVRMVYDDLRLRATQWYRVQVRTPQHTIRFILEAKKGHWGGTAFREVAGEWVAATRVTHHIDYAKDVVTVRVPVQALGNPAWVQVRLRSDLGVDAGTFFTDNPMTHRAHSAFSDQLQLP